MVYNDYKYSFNKRPQIVPKSFFKYDRNILLAEMTYSPERNLLIFKWLISTINEWDIKNKDCPCYLRNSRSLITNCKVFDYIKRLANLANPPYTLKKLRIVKYIKIPYKETPECTL